MKKVCNQCNGTGKHQYYPDEEGALCYECYGTGELTYCSCCSCEFGHFEGDWDWCEKIDPNEENQSEPEIVWCFYEELVIQMISKLWPTDQWFCPACGDLLNRDGTTIPHPAYTPKET